MRLRERPVHARAERAQLVEREHVLQALERHLMAHLRKGVERVAAGVLRRPNASIYMSVLLAVVYYLTQMRSEQPDALPDGEEKRA